MLFAAGIAAAVQQLTVAAKISVWLLHTANPKLLAGTFWGGKWQLKVLGTAAVAGRLPDDKRADWEQQLQGGVDVSCARLPATAGIRMRVRVREVH